MYMYYMIYASIVRKKPNCGSLNRLFSYFFENKLIIFRFIPFSVFIISLLDNNTIVDYKYETY